MLVYTEQTHKTKPVFILRYLSHRGPLRVKKLSNWRNKKACDWLSSRVGSFRCWWEAWPCYVELRQSALRALCKQRVYFCLLGWMNEAEVRYSTSVAHCSWNRHRASHAVAVLSFLTDQHTDLNYDMLSMLVRLLNVSKRPYLIMAASAIKNDLDPPLFSQISSDVK